MYPFERYEVILDACKSTKTISIQELLRITGSSISTLRRDIDHLARNGQIKKFRGGISHNGSLEQSGNFLYDQRIGIFANEKESIGKAAQHYIDDGDIIVLLYGTTTIHVARNIDPNKNVTLITNGIDILYEMRNKPNVKVIVLGGAVNYSNNCIEGKSVLTMLHDLNPSKIILGAGGITEKNGITNYEFLGATNVTDIVRLVDNRIIVADHSKFGKDVLTNVMPIQDVAAFVTDSKIHSQFIDMFEKHSIDYKIADG